MHRSEIGKQMKSAKINNYSVELRNKVLQEVKETGNMALVARAHELKVNRRRTPY